MFPTTGSFRVVLLGLGILTLASAVRAGEVPTTATQTQTQTCRWNPPGPLSAQHLQCRHPVTDSSTDFSPWSHKPLCAHSKNGTDTPYCVYTHIGITRGSSSNRNSSSGISILTTPEIAADLAWYLFDDPDPRWLHAQGRVYYVSPEAERQGENMFKLTTIPGKGKGLLATRKITAGEVVIREVPAVMNDVRRVPEGLDPKRVDEIIEAGVNRLNRERQEAVFALTGAPKMEMFHGLDVQIMGPERVKGILDKNSVGMVVEGGFWGVLGVAVARMNHACQPNVFTRFNHETMTIEAVAYVDIQKGEELTITYLPLNLLSESRKQMTQQWGFNCTCSMCSNSAKATESDNNKLRIQEVLNELEDKKNRKKEKVDSLAQELFGLLEKERLIAQIGSFSSLLIGVYISMGDLEKAREYAAAAVGNHTLYEGFASEKVKAAREMVEMLEGVEVEYE